jgi:hypothetical protein
MELTLEEKAALQKLATDGGVSRADVIRAFIRSSPTRPGTRREA